jgi:putative transposase
VRFRDTRPLRGVVKNVTVTLDGNGWHIAFACAIEHVVPANRCPALGIDRGVANTLALSAPLHIGKRSFDRLSLPDSLECIGKQKRHAQRVLARRKKGSKRRLKQLRRLARLSARQARIRNDWQHRRSFQIAQQFGDVALEDLNIKNMTASAKGTIEQPGRNVGAKASLNRAILRQGWHGFVVKLAYKLEERGGALSIVAAAYTTSISE